MIETENTTKNTELINNQLINNKIMIVTEKEQKVIQAIKNSEFLEEPSDPIWIKGLAEDAELDGKEFSGVVSSLIKKEIVFSDGETIGLTVKGQKIADHIILK